MPASERPTWPTSRPSMTGCGRRTSCPPPHSRRSGISWTCTSPVDRGSSCLDPHLGRYLGDGREAAQAKERLATAGGRPRERRRLRDAGGGNGAGRARRAARGPGRRLDREVVADPRRRARSSRVVRRRHARISAPRRPDRCRVGVPRLGAADQADPHARQEIEPIERVRTGAKALSAWSSTRNSCESTAPTLRRPAHPDAERGWPARQRVEQIWAARRCSSPRSGR